ncbi:MAG: flagellar hook-associated protein FlgK [Desulfobacteraceae bacterium]
MASIYGVLDVGRQGLLVQQEAINVTAHNISNANTPGYTRQRLITETTTPITTKSGQMGTGVRAGGIERAYDRYLTQQISDETEIRGKWEAAKEGLERVELVFNEASGSGLQESMGAFWNAWQDLANNPSGQTERQMLVGAAENMAYNFQQAYNDLAAVQDELNTNISQAVSQINVKAEEIAELNRQIIHIEAGGDTANDHRDKRDLRVKELSEMIDISASEQDNGSVTITLGAGGTLVEVSDTYELSTVSNPSSGFSDVVWADDPTETPINDDISGGKLRGWLDVRDVTIEGYKSDMDSLVISISDEVNDLHSGGYGLDGSTGNDFFTGALEDNDFEMNSDLSDDINKIAASGTAAGVPGDNSNAVAIADLQHSLTMSSNTATFDDYYNSIVSSVGFDVQAATSSYTNRDAMISSLENYRESISGVSLDEEMINMIQQESAYQAAAKLISNVDEMLQTLMAIV